MFFCLFVHKMGNKICLSYRHEHSYLNNQKLTFSGEGFPYVEGARSKNIFVRRPVVFLCPFEGIQEKTINRELLDPDCMLPGVIALATQ